LRCGEPGDSHGGDEDAEENDQGCHQTASSRHLRGWALSCAARATDAR
jgi:hypothetical protein